MKATFFTLVSLFFLTTGCNDKPEVQPDTNNYLVVFPNPTNANSTIGVRSPGNSSFMLKVFDPKGNVILEKNSQGPQYFNISLSEKPAGNYQAILQIDNTVISKTLLKINR